MRNEEENDLIDNRKVPQLYLHEDYVLTGAHHGTVNVESGSFTLEGVLRGTLNIRTTEIAKIKGVQQGTVTICQNAMVIVTGAIQGTTTVQHGATLIIESGAKLAGALTNNGTVIVRGVFGGPKNGNGNFMVEGEGYIKQPTIKNGVTYYNW